MKLTLGGLRVTAAGGADRDGGGEGPAILLCHGFGAPGDDLVPLARVVDAGKGVRWFFPEAPLELDLGFGMSGRAWWNIDMMRWQEMLMRGERRLLMDETPEGLAEAREALSACIDELCDKRGVDRSQLIIGGFSQGGMLTTEIALHAASREYAGLAVLSGTLLSQDRWRAAAAATGGTLDVFMSHGRADPLLPFEAAEELKTLLERAGARIDWVPHGGQHEIPGVVLERFGVFCRARLGT